MCLKINNKKVEIDLFCCSNIRNSESIPIRFRTAKNGHFISIWFLWCLILFHFIFFTEFFYFLITREYTCNTSFRPLELIKKSFFVLSFYYMGNSFSGKSEFIIWVKLKAFISNFWKLKQVNLSNINYHFNFCTKFPINY